MAVFLGDEQVRPPRDGRNADPLAMRLLPFLVQCADATDDVEELDSICTPMQKWATSVLGRSRLGGLVHWVRETGTRRAPTHGDTYVMTITQVYECQYQTRRDNITVAN